MRMNFYKSESSVKPELIDSSSSKKYVYFRQNIEEVTNENGTVIYKYEEAKLTLDEYKTYLDEINAGTVMETMEKYKELTGTEHKDIESTTLSQMDKLFLILDSIPVIEPEGTVTVTTSQNTGVGGTETNDSGASKVFPEKLGYKWKPKYNGTAFVWELVKDPNYVPVNDGSDYLKAIAWFEGDAVIEGLWYDVGDQVIWQAKKSGFPASAEDTEYFDIP